MIENQNPTDSTAIPNPLPLSPAPKKSKKGLIITLIVGLIALIAIGFLIKDKLFKPEIVSNEYDVAAVESIFSAPAYNEIHYNYKTFVYHFLYENSYLDGTYFMTKIPDRAKKVFAFGNFTDDGEEIDDLAVILEKNDFKSSKLVIFNRKGELLFIEDYDDELPVISSFRTGAKIFLEERNLVNAPNSGLIVQKQSSKYVVLYDKVSKKFNSYYQYTDNDLIDNGEEYSEEGDYEMTEETQTEQPKTAPENTEVKKENSESNLENTEPKPENTVVVE